MRSDLVTGTPKAEEWAGGRRYGGCRGASQGLPLASRMVPEQVGKCEPGSAQGDSTGEELVTYQTLVF